MQAIRTLIWVIVAVVITVFAVANAEPVSVNIWPGSRADMPLSILIILVFLLGFLPPFLLNLGNRWRLSRRISQQEQVIAQLRPTTIVAATPAPAAPPSPLSTDGSPS
jgi:uncharacterized integral membrane protein